MHLNICQSRYILLLGDLLPLLPVSMKDVALLELNQRSTNIENYMSRLSRSSPSLKSNNDASCMQVTPSFHAALIYMSRYWWWLSKLRATWKVGSPFEGVLYHPCAGSNGSSVKVWWNYWMGSWSRCYAMVSWMKLVRSLWGWGKYSSLKKMHEWVK